MKEKCYFVYCWDKYMDLTERLMKDIKSKIEKRSYGNIQVIWDKDNIIRLLLILILIV